MMNTANNINIEAGRRLLVVDDEQEFVSTLVKRLRRRGMVCATAFTGSEAIESVRREPFDMVLLDMKLPDIDGNEVLREIKKLRPQTQVVILTGHISARDGMESIGGGANDYLMKPVEFESLLESLQRASQRRGFSA